MSATGVSSCQVVVIERQLTDEQLAAVRALIARLGGAIGDERVLAKDRADARELTVEGVRADQLRRSLVAASIELGVGTGVRSDDDPPKRLMVMDVDSTLMTGEVIDSLAAYAGKEQQVAQITERAMRGELDFRQSLQARVAMLEGLPEQVIDDVRASLQLTPGARTLLATLRARGYVLGMVSGGFRQVTDPVAELLGMDYTAANTLEVRDGRLTGKVTGPVIDRSAKAASLREFAASHHIDLSECVAVGDGANDLDMIEAAGLGVAFNAKDVARRYADASITVPRLDAVAFLLGITEGELIDTPDTLELRA